MPSNDQIKNAIMTYGGVTARVCVDNGWSSYSGGVYNPTSNGCPWYGKPSINHQIVLVGWDDATQSWLLRNSWGTSWGENGYMRIKYDPAGTTSRVGEGSSWIAVSGSSGLSSLSVSKIGSGTVTSSPAGINCGTACSASFASASSVTLTATPSTGYRIGSWGGACSGTANTCKVSMNAAKSVSIQFVQSSAPLSVSKTGSGTVTSSPAGINCGTACSASFASASSVTLTAIPSTGHRIGSWGGACSGTANTCTVSMNAAKSVIVQFVQSTITPAAPSGLAATTSSSSQANLTWVDNSTNETGFAVERKTGATGTWSQIASLGANVRTYSNTGLVAGTTYYYRIRAYNGSANSEYSNDASATPTVGSCSSSTTTISVSSTFNGTLATTDCTSSVRSGKYYDNFTFAATAGTQYTITLNSTAFDAYLYLLNSAGQTLIFDDDSNGVRNAKIVYNPTASGTLTIHATSYSSGATGSYTVMLNAGSGTVGPVAPSTLTATIASLTRANLTWVDNSTNETGFAVERKTGATGTWSKIASLGANVRTYSNAGLVAGATYYYRVRAYNGSGNSGYSNEATVTTSIPLPDFLVTNITLSPTTPRANSTFSAIVTVKNQGTASGNGGWLDVWTNQSGVPGCGADGNQYKAVGTLAAGASATFTFSGLTTVRAAGAKTFRAYVDSFCQRIEGSEVNNQSARIYTVQ